MTMDITEPNAINSYANLIRKSTASCPISPALYVPSGRLDLVREER
jgi:hypothetical protein